MWPLHSAYSWQEVHDALSLIGPARNLQPRYNIAPTQDVPICRLEDDERRLIDHRWGLIPFWSKDEKIAYRTINARAEGIEKKPAFRAAFKERRCLVPADGFYEWTGPKGDRQPYKITMKCGEVFAMAGLWERWTPKDQEPVVSFTIVTCEPNELVGQLHNRMPVILKAEDYGAWLDGSAGSEPLVPYPADQMDMYPVGKAVGNVRNQGPELIEIESV